MIELWRLESNYYPEQQKVKGGWNKYEDKLARKVTQLESKLEQVRNQKPVTYGNMLSTTPATVERVPNPSVVGMKRTVSDLNKKVGRLRLLQEQRMQMSKKTAISTPPSASTERPSVPATDHPTSEHSTRRSYYCGGLGHFIRDCAEKKKLLWKEGADVVAGASLNSDRDASAAGQTYIRLHVNGHLRKCLLDTGTDVTILPLSVVAEAQYDPTNRRLLAREWYLY